MSGVSFDSKDFNESMGALAHLAPEALLSAGRASALVLSKYTIQTKLISANPPFLNRRTGTLVRSVAASPRAVLEGDRVKATYGSRLDYAFKHEFGGTFTEHVTAHHVNAHTRRGHARRSYGGKRVWVEETRVDSFYVQAYTRVRTYRRRLMFTTALEEKRDVAPTAARVAINFVMANEKVPTPRQVIARMGGI